ncbi:MAG TPA: lipoprotein-releasing system ATP-binding protein LolD [Actinobacteria bacterium]|nr:lipoprotein-releasing system ATP-binding protein LolD [Actinomycetota bacterium]
MVRIKNITKYFKLGSDTIRAVDKISCNFERSKMTAVVGKSGCGKSTLLNILGALEKPDSGEIYVDDLELSGLGEKQTMIFRRNKIGFIFQSFNLIPNMTVMENVLLPIEFSRNREINYTVAANLLNRVGIGENRFRHTPGKLSGGEQQRVAIARALINNPPIILADEPTGNLDDKTGNAIRELLKELTRQEKTVIIVTHDMEIKNICDRNILLEDGKVSSESN